MAKMVNDAYQKENTRGKVSMSGAMAEADAMMAEEVNTTPVDKIIKDTTAIVADLNAQVKDAYASGKQSLLKAMESDPTYNARKEATDDFTIQWCPSLRSKGTDDPDYIRTEVFGRRTLHAYKFDINECTFCELVTEWNSATEVVAELRELKLKAAREASQAKRKAEEARVQNIENENKRLQEQAAANADIIAQMQKQMEEMKKMLGLA